MPTANVSNPDANFNTQSRIIKGTRQRGRASLTQVDFRGVPRRVPETVGVRYKKKPARGRKAARGRAALTIQLDSERPIPRF